MDKVEGWGDGEWRGLGGGWGCDVVGSSAAVGGGMWWVYVYVFATFLGACSGEGGLSAFWRLSILNVMR